MNPRLLTMLALAVFALFAAACSGETPQPTATSGSGKAPAAASPTVQSDTRNPTPSSGGSATATQKPSSPSGGQASSNSTSEPAPEEEGVRVMDSPEAGVQVFLWGSPNVERDLELAKAAGFTWVKQMFQWNYIERDGKGEFLWNEPDRLVKAANLRDIKIIARLDFTPDWAKDPSSTTHNGPPADYEDFGDFVYALVDRYSPGSEYGEIHAFEIWNEPNLAREWGGKEPNAAEYVELLKVAYKAAKRANPNAMIVTAGLSPTGTMSAEARPDDVFLEEMYQAGAKDYFDVLGVHAAGFKAPPETSPEELASTKEFGGQRFFGFRRVEDLRGIMVENGDEDKQVMVLEMGWTTDNRDGSPYAWHAVTEEEKGDYIVRAYDFARENWAPWIGVMTTIYISAPHWTPEDEQYYWALTEPDGTPRESLEYITGKLP